MRNPLAVVGLLAVSSLAAQPEVHPDELALKPRIDAAISAGVESLLDRQLRDGSWGVHGDYFGGRAGLCVYALLRAGMRLDHPAMQRAFAYLDHQEPRKTYSVACMILAYGATGRDRDRERVRQLATKLLEWQKPDGSYGYPERGPDLSNMQYAALGLWVASKNGAKIPIEVWEDLIRATFEYRETPHRVEPQGEVAGFGYRRLQKLNNAQKASGKHEHRATGSMTTAGVSILKICELGAGKKLRKRTRRAITQAITCGVDWLGANFSVKKNPGMGGGRLLYYLYGMERVGSLTRRERFGEHWWYLEGARHLLDAQRDGAWGNESDTCFALLFLRRATVMGGPTTGSGAGLGSRHTFAAGGPADAIDFRGAGQQPLSIYINGFAEHLLQEHEEHGLRILRVEYFKEGRKLEELASDPMKAWSGETFVHRCAALPRGTHTLEARVVAIAPEVPLGETTETVTIRSAPMQVVIRDVVEPWMESIARMQRGNLIRKGTKATVSSSSIKHDDAKKQAEQRKKQAESLTDGKNDTVWLSAVDDPTPTVTLSFARSIKARRLILTQALVRESDRKKIGAIRQVQLAWNGSRRFETLDLHEDPLAPTEHAFRKVRVLRELTIRVVSRTGETLPVGFAEIVLLADDQRGR